MPIQQHILKLYHGSEITKKDMRVFYDTLYKKMKKKNISLSLHFSKGRSYYQAITDTHDSGDLASTFYGCFPNAQIEIHEKIDSP